MNYIGKFFSNIYEYYNDLNPATLSGAIDVVIVEQEDGTFASSPFHVRFGKRGVLYRGEKIVDITINGEPVSLRMKLGDTGEAFFVQETEVEEEAEIPALLATSPLPQSHMHEAGKLGELSSNHPQNIPPQFPRLDQTAPKSMLIDSEQNRNNKREQSESPARELPDYSQEPEKASKKLPRHSPKKLRTRRRKKKPTRPASKEDIFKMDLTDEEREEDVDEDLEELNKEHLGRTSSLPDFLSLAQGTKTDKSEAKVDKIKIRHRRLSSHSVAYIPKNLHVTFAPAFSPRKASTGSDVQTTKSEGQLTPPNSLMVESMNSGFMSDSEVDLKKSETRKLREDDGANVTWKWGQLPQKNAAATPEAMTPTSQGSLESLPEATQQNAANTTEDQEKRSYLRGMFSFMRSRRKATSPIATSAPKDIGKVDEEAGKYLSDLAEENLSRSQKERYLALGALDHTSTENISSPQSSVSPTGTFSAPSYSHSKSGGSPSAIQPASLESRGAKNGIPATVEVEGKNIDIVPLSAQERGKGVDVIVNAFGQDAKSSAYSSMAGSPHLSDSESDKNSEKGQRRQNAVFKKSLRLTSEQIMNLPLQHGVNEAEFCIVTKYQGSARCKCNIFLWKYDDKIVISDIDGTITKSDVLGHILPIIGSTWAQAGVAGLYTRVASNGYKFLYLSSRAIGQASFTREHLKAIIQENVNLPEGPLLLSPKSLFLAFHQEVIVKRPEEFKIACLKDIRALFPPDRNPFFAAYGNKTTDLLAYRAVGVPMTRIFTINYQGQLKHEILRHAASSYTQQTNLVDMLFPPLRTLPGTDLLVSEHEHAEEFSSLTYWKTPLPDIDAAHLIPPLDEEKTKLKKATVKDKVPRVPEKVPEKKSTSPVKSARNAPLIII